MEGEGLENGFLQLHFSKFKLAALRRETAVYYFLKFLLPRLIFYEFSDFNFCFSPTCTLHREKVDIYFFLFKT